MRTKGLCLVARIAIVASLVLPVSGYAALGKKDFLGCRWDIGGLHEQADGGYALDDNQELKDGNFLVHFYEERFRGLGPWADFQAKIDEGNGIVTSRFVTNDQTAEPGIAVYVIERSLYLGHVVMINQHHTGLIDKCEPGGATADKPVDAAEAAVRPLADVGDDAQGELQERESILALTLQLMADEDFSTLDELAERYRSSASRTSSGVWHLSAFYQAFKFEIGNKLQSSDETALQEVKAVANRWLTEFPASPTGHLFYAMALTAEARRDRAARSWPPVDGRRELPTNTVTPARAYLEGQRWITAVDPQWYEVMATVALVERWEFVEFLALIDEALDREPLFYETYFRAVDYFTALAFRSKGAIEALARSAVDRTAADEGEAVYARIYWYASQTDYGNDLFQDSSADWPMMRAGFIDLLEKYPDPWNLNYFAKFSCLAKDEAVFGQLVELVESDFVHEAWSPRSLHPQCQFWLRMAEGH